MIIDRNAVPILEVFCGLLKLVYFSFQFFLTGSVNQNSFSFSHVPYLKGQTLLTLKTVIGIRRIIAHDA